MPQCTCGSQKATSDVSPYLLVYLRQDLLFTTACARLAGLCASVAFPIFTSRFPIGIGLQVPVITPFYMSSGHLKSSPSTQPKLYTFNK